MDVDADVDTMDDVEGIVGTLTTTRRAFFTMSRLSGSIEATEEGDLPLACLSSITTVDTRRSINGRVSSCFTAGCCSAPADGSSSRAAATTDPPRGWLWLAFGCGGGFAPVWLRPRPETCV